jgi:hypothetical protein
MRRTIRQEPDPGRGIDEDDHAAEAHAAIDAMFASAYGQVQGLKFFP